MQCCAGIPRIYLLLLSSWQFLWLSAIAALTQHCIQNKNNKECNEYRNTLAYSYNVFCWNKTVKNITKELIPKAVLLHWNCICTQLFSFLFLLQLIFSIYFWVCRNYEGIKQLFQTFKISQYPQKEKKDFIVFPHFMILNSIYAFIIKAIESLLIYKSNIHTWRCL